MFLGGRSGQTLSDRLPHIGKIPLIRFRAGHGSMVCGRDVEGGQQLSASGLSTGEGAATQAWPFQVNAIT